ncbi:hypothetical protein M2105_005660 [Paenibacillus sp. PastF-1]|nr:hypothetical protein [Paenibacillus sp. PastF-2]MDF9851867.1 hypothetical protein [Paenibacillus sp. PastM-2]MDF9857762.1 hypothetical protein [Paenibacillus sp. PastF-1]MDH6483029.1 hypothetical protein [Paenibacillus sp. PastH-2]MDH6509168.1 hypothetical protein [Paenibacillus sp. PastM-3]
MRFAFEIDNFQFFTDFTRLTTVPSGYLLHHIHIVHSPLNWK